MPDSPQHKSALRYVDGRFEPIHDPLYDVPQEDSGSDMVADLQRLGYEEFFTIGDSMSPMSICTYRKKKTDGSYTYMVSVWDIHQGGPSVYVDDYGALMDIVARWSPAVQTAAVTALIRSLEGLDDISHHGLVERIAARAAYGMGEGLAVTRAEEASARRQRQEHRNRQK